MIISEQEISHLLSYAPFERTGNTSSYSRLESAVVTSHRTERVNISIAAQDVQRVMRAIDRLPDVRQDRVLALKARIDNGTYNVSSADIADLIIRRTLADHTAL